MNALVMTHSPEVRLSFGRVTRSETLKQFTLRSTYWVLGLTIAMWVGMTAIVLSQANSFGDAALFYGEAPMALYQVAMFVLPICGVLAVTNEYASGMIRTTLAAVPTRVPVLAAKSIVVAAITLATCAIVFTLNIGLTLAFGGSQARDAVFASESLGKYALVTLILIAMSLIGLALGFLLRNTAGAIGATIGLFFLVPMVFQMAQSIEWLYNLRGFFPAEAANCLLGVYSNAPLTQLQGGLVLAAWVAVLLAGAGALLRRRDV